MRHIADPNRYRADRWDDTDPPRWFIMDTHNAGQQCAGPFDTPEDAGKRQDRLNRLHALAGEYPGPWITQDPDETVTDHTTLAVHQFAAIRIDEPTYTITTHETMPDALATLASAVVDGDCALGVIDLDTGASHGVHIATPVVSDIGGEGATAVPWDDVDIPALDPGRITSRQGSAW